jgi:hypothetical protein
MSPYILIEEAIQVLKQLAIFVNLLTPKALPDENSSRTLRRMAFDTYTELHYQIRAHNVTHALLEIQLSNRYELLTMAIHKQCQTFQVGTMYATPQ